MLYLLTSGPQQRTERHFNQQKFGHASHNRLIETVHCVKKHLQKHLLPAFCHKAKVCRACFPPTIVVKPLVHSHLCSKTTNAFKPFFISIHVF